MSDFDLENSYLLTFLSIKCNDERFGFVCNNLMIPNRKKVVTTSSYTLNLLKVLQFTPARFPFLYLSKSRHFWPTTNCE